MRAEYIGRHTMHDEYTRKVRYGRLLDAAAKDKHKNLDLKIQRFKAVGRGKCIGFFSTLNMAFGEVDMAVGRLGAGPWTEATGPRTEVKVTTLTSCVEDLVAKRTYVRMGGAAESSPPNFPTIEEAMRVRVSLGEPDDESSE